MMDIEVIQKYKVIPIEPPHWIVDEGGRWAECSECHEAEKIGEMENHNYCPNCGAKMEGLRYE